MKRFLAFGVLPLMLGLFGAWLRANELVYVFDAQTGLPANTMWVSPALITLSVFVFAFSVVSAFICKKPSPKTDSKLLPSCSAVSLLILLVLGGFEFFSYMQSFAFFVVFNAILSIVCGASLFFIGSKKLEMRDNVLYNVFAALPAFWACFAVILVFRERIAHPIVSSYAYLLFAFLSILIFTYSQCGYIFGKKTRKSAIISGVCAIYFCTVEFFSQIFAYTLSAGSFPAFSNAFEVLPLIAFLIYIPAALVEILSERNIAGN